LQWLKKIVPEPWRPTSGGSSPKCGWAEATFTREMAPHTPVSPFNRLIPHRRGQSWQLRKKE
jgi:hypothetical protein